MRSVSGSPAPRPQRLLAAALGLAAAGVAGPAGVPHGSAMEMQEPAPWVEEDFSSYHSTADLLADPRGIYSGGSRATRGRITLDQSVALPGLAQSMRYTWPDRSNDPRRCTSYDIGRDLDFPQPVVEVWVEIWFRFSPDFQTVMPGCRGRSNPDYKMVFGRVTSPGRDRFQVKVGTFGQATNVEYPGYNGPSGYPQLRAVADGRWHRWRAHWRVSPQGLRDGRCVVYFDDRVVKDFGQVVIPRGAIVGLGLGRTMNQGPPHVQSLNWGRIRVWNRDPGWGF